MTQSISIALDPNDVITALRNQRAAAWDDAANLYAQKRALEAMVHELRAELATLKQTAAAVAADPG